MAHEPRVKSAFESSIRKLRRHPPAIAGFLVLVFLYGICLFAEFIAPYGFDSEDRTNSYAPPTAIHIKTTAESFLPLPVFYSTTYGFDQFYRRVFVEDTAAPHHLALYVKGEPYRMLGFIKSDRHLFGARDGGRIYLMGADARGRDLFSRIVHGSRVSLTVGLLGVFISTVLGLLIGGLAGYYGGTIDFLLMRSCEMVMLVPGFYLLLAMRAAFPPEMPSSTVYLLIVLILSFIGWAGLARVIRGMAKSIRQREFVLAAQALGQRDMVIIFKHIIPQTFSFLIVSITLAIPGYILAESGLSLIGLGIQDPQASWGNLLSDAMNIADIRFHPWILIPGLFIFATVMAFNFLGDGLRDVFDPKAGK